MKKLIFLFACVFMVAGASFAQNVRSETGGSADELRKLYERFLDASRVRDKAALDEIMTNDYTQVLGDRRIRDKSIRTGETMSPQGSIDVLKLRDFKVRFYGDAAVAICDVREEGSDTDRRPFKYDIVSTATFVRQKGKWRIAATHISSTESK